MGAFSEGFFGLASLDYVHDFLRANDAYSSIVCGAIAGICAKTVIAPAERIKMSFQVSSEPFTYRGVLHRTVGICRDSGVLSLWKGHSTTLIRVTPYAGLNYAFHDMSERSLKEYMKADQLPFFCKFLCGAVAGAGATLCTYPLDVLRVRIALGELNLK